MVPWKIADGIADVRLDRADKMNALDPAMFRAIAEAGARLKDDRSLRAVVLSGEGSAFCAGLDVERVAAMAAGSSILPLGDSCRPKFRHHRTSHQALISALFEKQME
jgi:enoyl-CoA hydratase/carnithine racemase